jgi:hypothetical protein
MNQTPGFLIAVKLMGEFAEMTALSPANDMQYRYLWTDAFAVCNFLGLYKQTNDETYKNLSLLLVDQVHGILGHHRDDDRRKGWISGLDELEGKLHPTIGGLRIGKKMNERGPNDPINDQLEWDRDGQYYHYLTKWMHALNQASSITGNPAYGRWAIELAKTAYAKFTYGPTSDRKRMYWKMSIDLSRPLVASMGHHDPLDGLITYCELQACRVEDSEGSSDLTGEIDGLAAMCKGKDWTTDDPLGIGGLLSDAYRVTQMMARGAFPRADLLAAILEACRFGLETYARTGSLGAPAYYRLAFRELGLSIGLHALERLRQLIKKEPGVFNKEPSFRGQVESLMRYRALAETIENFWLQSANREVPSFTDHRDINTVMLATSLAPDGYLML